MTLYRILDNGSGYGVQWVSVGDIVTPTARKDVAIKGCVSVEPVFTAYPWKQKTVILRIANLEKIEDAADGAI